MFTAQPLLPSDEPRFRTVSASFAAGVDPIFVVPDGYYWDFISADLKLTTSAAAANRTPTLNFDDGANRFWSDQGPVQIAGAVVDYLVGQGTVRDVALAAFVKLAGPDNLRLFAGYRVFMVTTNLQAGDQWLATLSVREWQSNAVSGPRAASRRAGGQNRFAAPRRPGRAY